jgi:hypothetical protein
LSIRSSFTLPGLGPPKKRDGCLSVVISSNDTYFFHRVSHLKSRSALLRRQEVIRVHILSRKSLLELLPLHLEEEGFLLQLIRQTRRYRLQGLNIVVLLSSDHSTISILLSFFILRIQLFNVHLRLEPWIFSKNLSLKPFPMKSYTI